MLVPILLFIVGLVLLIKGGDWFVDGATGLAHRFHVPEILIGATVVSIGTTLPEVMVSATSAVSGHGEIAYGNAIGSVICNTALIAALTIAIRPSEADRRSLRTPVIFFFIAAVFYAAIAYTNGAFTRLAGIVLLVMFAVYMVLTVRQSFRDTVQAGGADEAIDGTPSMGKDILLLVIGAAFIAVGANLLVNNGTLIAQGLGVPESVIALTFVALGTSLPELVTSIVATKKGDSGLALGNAIGSNLFNILFILGMSAVISPLHVLGESVIDTVLLLGSAILLFVFARTGRRMTRSEGAACVLLYVAYTAYLFVR